MDIETLRVAVDEAFAVTGASTPPWPDPHPDHREPAEEEYSRCLEPGKYRILKARAGAWTEALTAEGLATVEPADAGAAWRDDQTTLPNHASWVRPTRPGALPLLLGSGPLDDVDDVDDAVVLIGAGEPAVLVESLPDCGCDACDDGSEGLLEHLDEIVVAVVTGDLVHVQSRRGTLLSVGSLLTATGRFARGRDLRRVAERARSRPAGHGVLTGAPWL